MSLVDTLDLDFPKGVFIGHHDHIEGGFAILRRKGEHLGAFLHVAIGMGDTFSNNRSRAQLVVVGVVDGIFPLGLGGDPESLQLSLGSGGVDDHSPVIVSGLGLGVDNGNDVLAIGVSSENQTIRKCLSLTLVLLLGAAPLPGLVWRELSVKDKVHLCFVFMA